jgi:hypothetical protein
MAYMAFISLICIAVLIQPILTFYIPGVAPLDFKKGDLVEVKVIIIYFLKSNKKRIYLFQGC